jgi:hypothetical protein
LRISIIKQTVTAIIVGKNYLGQIMGNLVEKAHGKWTTAEHGVRVDLTILEI